MASPIGATASGVRRFIAAFEAQALGEILGRAEPGERTALDAAPVPPDSVAVLIRFGKGLLVLALTLSIGAHWACLQSLAWAGMLYQYSREAGVSQAVAMTFDGDHPCGLCNAIEKGKAQEREQQHHQAQVKNELKLDLPPAAFVFEHPDSPPVLPARFIPHPAQTRAPELPPPRPA